MKPVALVAAAAVVLAMALAPLAWTSYLAHREAAVVEAASSLDLVASLATHESRVISVADASASDRMAALTRSLPAGALTNGRVAYLSDPDGRILASSSREERRPRSLREVFGQWDAVRALEDDGSVLQTRLQDGTSAFATMRDVAGGHLTVVEPRSPVTDAIRSLGAASPFLLALVFGSGAVGFGATRLGRGCHARGADASRFAHHMEATLARGRCGLWRWDVARQRMTWSASMYELLGYEPRGAELLYGEVAAILRPEAGSLVELMDLMTWSGLSSDHELRARTASGDWLWLRLKAEAVTDPADGSRHVVGVAIDITDERGVAERRAFADRRVRDAVEALSEAFVLWDADDRLILCNSKFLKLHQLPPEMAAPGTPASEILKAGRPPLVEKQLTGHRPQEPGTRTFETKLFDGRWLHVNERRTRDGGVVSVATDVSALKLAEEKLLARERRLKGSVRAAKTEAQRFAALAERSYEANQAKTEFLARMSHELRTPLNAIIGFADMMRQEVLGPLGCGRYAEYSRDIHLSGLKLLDVIDGILQMSRIESGRVRLAPRLMMLDASLEKALGEIAPEAQSKGIVIETDIARPCLLQADERAVREIFAQLLRNAVKFTEEGGTVRLRVRPADKRLHIFVEDSGIGIAPEVLPLLGRPFEQVEAEYSRAGGGPGLGLAIARSLAELHGGRLRMRSQPGTGTVVLVALPVVQPPANDIASESDDQPFLPLVAAE